VQLLKHFRKINSPKGRLAIFIAGATIIFLAILWLIPQLQVPQWQVPKEAETSNIKDQIKLENEARKEKFNIENEARKTIAQILAGGFFLLTAYLTWRTVRASEQNAKVAIENLKITQDKVRQDQEITNENLKLAQENLRAASDKQLMERFAKAAESLEAPNVSARLGGIYGLERIAKDSPDDHVTIMEVLTAFLREKAHLTTPLPAPKDRNHPRSPIDIQAALTVLGRREWRDKETQRMDLHSTDLRWARLRKAQLDWVNLAEANLTGAKLENASLRSSRLVGINLSKANLTNADFSKSDHGEAKPTRLVRALLCEADLTGADLSRANLKNADFTNAVLKGTILKGAILTNVIGLTQQQLDSAIIDTETQVSLPQHPNEVQS
jgi:uncharacterized protein YjbI with pentapeptide repeats